MANFFSNLSLDISSFWAGIFLVVILIGLYFRFRKRIQSFLSRLLSNIINFRESLSVSSDGDYIQVLYKYTQSLHIGADFFPLDSILVPPACTAPPPGFFPDKTITDTSLVQLAIGYDPMLPVINAEYFGPRFNLFDAVMTQTNICLVGLPGTGKTTAMAACMAELIVNRSQPDPENLKLPFYIKAHHLLAQFPDSNILGVLIKAIQSNKAFQAIPNFPKYLTTTINSGKAILFLDDIDLLSYPDVNRVSNFLQALVRNFPQLQIVASATPSCLGNLPSIGLEIISVSSWGDSEKYAFLDKLTSSWPNAAAPDPVSPLYEGAVRHAMLVVSDRFSTPLEFTIKSIAAFAGDLKGPSPSQAIASHIERQLNNLPGISDALEIIALHILQTGSSSFSKRGLNAWLHNYYRDRTRDGKSPSLPAFSSIIQTGLSSGLIESTSADEYYFSSPTFAGYLAAKGLSGLHPQAIQAVLTGPDWSIMRETMRFFARFNSTKSYLKSILNDRTLFRVNIRRASLWAAELDINSPEEEILLKFITKEINANPLYLTKLRLICGLTYSKNPTIRSIFQHLLKNENPATRRAAAIGCGLLKDLSAVPALISQLNDSFPSNIAACYALGRIGSPRSLEAIAEALLHGSELLRRAAAESLAQNRSEGHPALREGAQREDLLVRYAVVHGLGQIPEDWSREILDQMRIDEKEWVVRDLAQQTYELMQSGSPYLPNRCPSPQNALWLNEFAASRNIPAPSRGNALEYLLKALEEGTDEQKQYSLAHLARMQDQDLISTILKSIENSPVEQRQLGELAAWLLAPPQQ